MAWNWLRGALGWAGNEATDDLTCKLVKDKYTDNLLGLMSIVQRVGFFGTMELLMRATQGEAVERPLGTNRPGSPWNQLYLNPVHFHRFPVEDKTQIDTSVVIGPAARRPLRLDIPIFITGMSYGSALSKRAKVALARGASAMGTATDTGEAGLLREEREAAAKLIGQYNRGGYLNSPDRYGQLDAIEMQFGQGAQGAAPQRTQAKFVDEEMREVFGVEEGQDVVLATRMPGVNSPEDLNQTVKRLRDETGVPVGVKLAASHYLEPELDVVVNAGVDFISVDGAEGATHAAAPTLEDDLGLPTIYAIARARRFLDRRNLGGRVTLLAGGGLFSPGQFLKALALGANAVYIGTAAVLAIIAPQMVKATPAEPPAQLVLHTGRLKDQLDVDEAAASLTNFLKLSVKEMTSVMYALGKPAVRDLRADDLVCVDPWLARALGVSYAGVSADEQASYYEAHELAFGPGRTVAGDGERPPAPQAPH